jgi:threonine aldolase
MVHLGVSPADLTWKAGVNILSLGTTKNGTLNAEAVIVFDSHTAETVRYLHKRAGFLQSKMRFCAAQLAAYVANDLWIENARKANSNARRIRSALERIPGVAFENRLDGNQTFVHLPTNAVNVLVSAGIRLRPWPHASGDLFRIVTSFSDDQDLIGRFEDVLKMPSALTIK